MPDRPPDFARAVYQALEAVSARTLTQEAAASRILAAHAMAALEEPEDKAATRERLWAKYLEFGSDRWAVGKAVAAVCGRDPRRRESAARWLRRERAKLNGHVRTAVLKAG